MTAKTPKVIPTIALILKCYDFGVPASISIISLSERPAITEPSVDLAKYDL